MGSITVQHGTSRSTSRSRGVRPPQILIIEDDAERVRDLSGHAERLGYTVCGIADNALKAVSLAKELHPDIVLMNSQLARAGNSKDIPSPLAPSFSMPIILLIAAEDKVNIKRFARAAKHGYLITPFQPRELRAAIEVALYKAKLERRLRDSERWFTDTLHCVNDGVIAVDTDGHIRFLNLAAEKILGVSLELVQDQKIENVLHFEEANNLSAAEVLRTGKTFGIDFGKWIFNEKSERLPVDHCAAPIRDDSEQLIGAVVVIRDASARIAAEEALRFSEERFRTAFEHATEGMALVTMDGRFVHGNPAICKLLKCSDIELQNFNISEITPPENRDTEKQRLRCLIIGSAPSLQFERQILPCHGAPLWVQVTVSLLLREESPFCYLYQFHDLAAQKLAESLEQQKQSMNKIHESTVQEKQLAQAANESKSAFIASMSHELRTPLNAILGFAQILENEQISALTSDQLDSIHNIQRAGWHLLDLINDTLDLGKIESGTLRFSIENVDLQELLPECIQLISAKAAESHIVVSAVGDLNFVVRVDRIRLRQVILNFLSNAVKYNRESGSVTVTCTQRGNKVRIAVTDTGAGLSDEQKTHLFEPFNRLGKESGKIEGSGIGLVITKSLVKSMQGVIGVESRPGAGCVFWVEFAITGRSSPFSENKYSSEYFFGEHATTSRSPSKKTSTRPRTILCIEDNPVNMLVVSKIIQQRPEWTLITATTGESGFELAVSAAPELILLDIGLPDVSGLELIQRLRKNPATRKIPVVAISANAGPEYIQQALAHGFDRYITKPIRLPELVQTIESLLSKLGSSQRGNQYERHIDQC